MPKPTRSRAAVYTKESAGYRDEENSRVFQTTACEDFCRAHGLRIVARYHDGVGERNNFHRMMNTATWADPPFDHIVVYRLRNFS